MAALHQSLESCKEVALAPLVRQAHPSDAPLDFPTIRVRLGPRMDESIEYDSYDELFQTFQKHCAPHGYSLVFRSQNKYKNGITRFYDCDRGGKPRDRKNQDTHVSKKRDNTGSRKVNCPFRINAKKLLSGKWKIEYKEENHNHEASDGPVNHPAHRIKTLDSNRSAEEVLKTLVSRMTKVSIIQAVLKRDWGIELTKRDIYNMRARKRIGELNGLTPIQWLAQELEERSFCSTIKTDKDNRVTHIFFVHPECIKLWQKSPDVLLIDATYKTNRFHQPLINICGCLGNNMTPQLAMAFVSGEKEADYRWVLECVKALIKKENIKQPGCFVSDRELALINALEHTFPLVPHILCRWHVNMNVVAKTKRHFTILEDWEEFFEAWLSVINSTTREEYEEKLMTLKKHNIKAVEYLLGTWIIWKEKIARDFHIPSL